MRCTSLRNCPNPLLYRNFLFFTGGYFPLFYLQLSGITHGVDPTLVFYSVSNSFRNNSSHLNPDGLLQIAIMNAANLPGRVIPNQFAYRLGVHNQMIVAAAICGALAIAFIGMRNAAGVVLIAIIYGFASGACKLTDSLVRIDMNLLTGYVQTCLCWHRCSQGFLRTYKRWGKFAAFSKADHEAFSDW